MINVGLKDITKKQLIPSSIMRVQVLGSSDISISFEDLKTLSIDLVGSSDITVGMHVENQIKIDVVGSSDVSIVFEKIKTKDTIEEIINFTSGLNLKTTGSSPIKMLENNKSSLTINITEKSILYGKENI